MLDVRRSNLAPPQSLPLIDSVHYSFHRDLHHRVFSQIQRLKRPEFASFVGTT